MIVMMTIRATTMIVIVVFMIMIITIIIIVGISHFVVRVLRVWRKYNPQRIKLPGKGPGPL